MKLLGEFVAGVENEPFWVLLWISANDSLSCIAKLEIRQI